MGLGDTGSKDKADMVFSEQKLTDTVQVKKVTVFVPFRLVGVKRKRL